jgi:hypothetical protein
MMPARSAQDMTVGASQWMALMVKAFILQQMDFEMQRMLDRIGALTKSYWLKTERQLWRRNGHVAIFGFGAIRIARNPEFLWKTPPSVSMCETIFALDVALWRVARYMSAVSVRAASHCPMA